MSKREPQRWLTDTRVQFVSLVDKAANETTFLLMKQAGANFSNYVELQKTWGGEPDGPRLVTGIVYQPDTVDSQGDAMTAEEIEKAAHWYMKNARGNDLQHNGVQTEGVWLAESAVTNFCPSSCKKNL